MVRRMSPSFPHWVRGSRDLTEGDRESLGDSVKQKSLCGGMETESLKSNTASRSLGCGGGGCRLVTKILNVGVRITKFELHFHRVLVSLFSRRWRAYLEGAF